MADTVKCPWCAEEILAEARKCKHCGEFLTDERPSREESADRVTGLLDEADPIQPLDLRSDKGSTSEGLGSTRECPWCDTENALDEPWCQKCGEYLGSSSHLPPRKQQAVAQPAVAQPANAVWSRGTWGWTCVRHGKTGCLECRSIMAPPKPVGRQRISEAGRRTQAGLACPRCGGTQFVAKRSAKGKAIGFATLGVGGLIAPKSRVKCVACGMMFLRG